MSRHNETPRGNKREIQKRLERHYDRARYDYLARVQPQRPKAILLGIGVATLLYGLAFAAMQYGYANRYLDSNTYFKLSWIIMIPSTVLGVLAWQIAKNRLEYPIRLDIRQLMNTIEGANGMLWRFQPLLDTLSPGDLEAKKVCAASQRGETAKIDIDDYAMTVGKLFRLLDEAQKTPSSLVEEVARNFND